MTSILECVRILPCILVMSVAKSALPVTVLLIESDGGHQLATLVMVGRWDDNEAVYIVQEEEDSVSNENAIRKVHKILNHKSKGQMYYANRIAGKLTLKVRKLIYRVVEICEVYKKNARSKSKPSVAISRATDFNSVVTVDLKVMEDKYILWMVCGFTKFIRERVIRDKNPKSIIKAIHEAWIFNCWILGK